MNRKRPKHAIDGAIIAKTIETIKPTSLQPEKKQNNQLTFGYKESHFPTGRRQPDLIQLGVLFNTQLMLIL